MESPMNILSHMLLSGDDHDIFVGNFMGDFIKGHTLDRYSFRVRQGIMLHRRIDSFAESEPIFRQSRQRLAPHYGLYRGILVDIFYDHFLIKEWNDWSKEPLNDYLARARYIVDRYLDCLPERLKQAVPVIFEKIIPLYGEMAGIGEALERMSRRLTRQNPLAGSEAELLAHYDGLRRDFHSFLPKARRFAENFIAAQNGEPDGGPSGPDIL